LGNENSKLWQDDLIGDRARHADFLQRFLVSKGKANSAPGKAAFVMNIDAPWGSGKTFFLTRFRDQLERNHPVVFINAWRSDYATDPLIPVIDGVLKVLCPTSGPRAAVASAKELARGALALVGAVTRGVAKQALRKYVGGEIEEMVSEAFGDDAGEAAEAGFEGGVDASFASLEAAGNDARAEFEATRRLVDDFETALAAAAAQVKDVTGKEGPIFVLVDELDRCRPPYAIKMLERVKHLFGVPGVVFIFATDTQQLRHSIGAVYGAEFDAAKYLQRFFNRTYSLGEPSFEGLAHSRLSEAGTPMEALSASVVDTPSTMVAQVANAFHLTARELERQVDILDGAVAAKEFKSPIFVPYFLALSISLDRGDTELVELLRGPAAARQHSEALVAALEERKVGDVIYRAPDRWSREWGQIGLRQLIVEAARNAHVNVSRLPQELQAQEGVPSALGVVGDLLVCEVQREHDGLLEGGREYPSVLSQYFDLIRSAGALKSAAD
jgi:hypothetical protein